MLHRLRRVRIPPSLEGYGPGRPSSSAAALAANPSSLLAPESSASASHAPNVPSSITSQSQSQSPSSSTFPTLPSPSSPSAPPSSHNGTDADRPLPVRQKMPLGSDRRDGEPDPVAGPSTAEARQARNRTRVVDDELKRAKELGMALRSQVGALGSSGAGGDIGGAAGGAGEDGKPKSASGTPSRLADITLPMMSERKPKQEPTEWTVIHAALARPNPPSPRALLSYVESRPQTYSVAAGVALAEYAKRRNDTRVQKGASDLVRKLRLHPFGVDTMPATPLAELTAQWHIADVQPNTMLLKRFPPIPKTEDVSHLLSSPALLIRRLHYLYLAAEPVPLPTALRMLEDAKGKTQDRQALLHLHLAYTPDVPFFVLESFTTVAETPWTRQTVHLATGALLRFYRAKKPSTAIMDDIRKLFSMFESPNPALRRTPGPETWRHIGEYALETDDETLAHLAFLGACGELSSERQRSWAMSAQPIKLAPPGDSDMDGLPEAKFLNLGRHLTRWERLMHRFETRGWAERRPRAETDPDSPLPRLMQKWHWCGRDGEAAAQERAAEKEKEREQQQQQQQASRRPRRTSREIVDDDHAGTRYAPDIRVLMQHSAEANLQRIDTIRGAGKKERKSKRKTEEQRGDEEK